MSEPISISNAIANKTFNSNAHPPIYGFQSDVNFTDLDVFTQGQPFDQFKKMHQSPEHEQFHGQLGAFMEATPQRHFYHVVAE